MDGAASHPTGDQQRLERIASAFQNGIVLVNTEGAVVWMDRTARRRVNGAHHDRALPLVKADRETIDCFISPAQLLIKGESLTVGVIQVEGPRQSPDLIAVIEGVLADSTSWFTRTIIEKLKAVGQPSPESNPRNSTVQLDNLSAREREVLGLICEGHGDARMADLLGLSENTVRNHVAALYRKIGVKRRTAAVIWARERGISCGDDLKPIGYPRRLSNGHPGNGHSANRHSGRDFKARRGDGHGGDGHDSGDAPPY